MLANGVTFFVNTIIKRFWSFVFNCNHITFLTWRMQSRKWNRDFPLPITIKPISFLFTLTQLYMPCFNIVPLANFCDCPSKSSMSSNPSNMLFNGCGMSAKSFSVKTCPLDTFLVKLITFEFDRRFAVNFCIICHCSSSSYRLPIFAFTLNFIVRQSLSIRGWKVRSLLQVKMRVCRCCISAFI